MNDVDLAFDFASVLNGGKSRMEIRSSIPSCFASRLQRLTYFDLIGPNTFF